MSRVYSALTGTPRPAGSAILDTPDDGVWENSADTPAETKVVVEDSPFIEIGGPGGPVFSGLSAPPPTVRLAPETKVETKSEPERVFPRILPKVTTPSHLSVRFHDVIARGSKPAGSGPDASLVAFHLPDHPISGEYRALRDEIGRQLPSTTSHVLFFSAAAAEAGMTTVLLNLAITLALEEGPRVLVVDGNINRPGSAAKLALKRAPGVCEVLAHAVPLTWAVQPSDIQNLDVLTTGEATDATSAAVCREFTKLLGQLRQWYDWVLVDAGVWGEMAERDSACPAADAVYLVTRDTDTLRPEFIATQGWVKELGGSLRGYVATKM